MVVRTFLALSTMVFVTSCAEPVAPAPPLSADKGDDGATVAAVFPLAVQVFYPCILLPDGTVGEMVDITGSVHVQTKVQTKAGGVTTVRTHLNFSNATGVGSVSGQVFRAANNERWTEVDVGNGPPIVYLDQNLRLVATGGGLNYQLMLSGQFVVDPGPPLTVIFEPDRERSVCLGNGG